MKSKHKHKWIELVNEPYKGIKWCKMCGTVKTRNWWDWKYLVPDKLNVNKLLQESIQKSYKKGKV